MEIPDSPAQLQPARKSRRRWWLGGGFLVLAVLVVGGVLVFSKPSGQRFRFVDGATLLTNGEGLMINPSGPPLLSQVSTYNSLLSLEETYRQARAELLPLGYSEGFHVSDAASFINVKNGSSVLIAIEGKAVFISVVQNRVPNALEYARVWLKEKLPFLSPKPKPQEAIPIPQ